MLSPNLAQLNRDAFVVDEADSTVRLEEPAATPTSPTSTSATTTRVRRRAQADRPPRPIVGDGGGTVGPA
jgi:hypothetical protein